MDVRRHTVALVGQAIADYTYETLSPSRFNAELVEARQKAQYKPGGFFVFSDLSPGEYILRLLGERFQPQQYTLTIPFAPLIFEQPGDNELVVIVKTLNNGSNRITFDPIIISQEIKAGALLHAPGATAHLVTGLDIGRVTEVKLDTLAGLAEGAIVRIVRGRSIRLKFGPYDPLPSTLTRIVGKVVRRDAPDVLLGGAQVDVTGVNGVNVVMNDVAGVRIATVDLNGTKTIVGLDRDMTTLANDRGDYNLYFGQGVHPVSVTLRATFSGYQAQTRTESIGAGQRQKVDFQLTSV